MYDVSDYRDSVLVGDVHFDVRSQFSHSLSHVELGRVSRAAFPKIERVKRAAGWVYVVFAKKVNQSRNTVSTFQLLIISDV